MTIFPIIELNEIVSSLSTYEIKAELDRENNSFENSTSTRMVFV